MCEDSDRIVSERIADGIFETYDMLVRKAIDAHWFHDDTAIQSAAATMFINYTKERSSVTPLVQQLRKSIAQVKDLETDSTRIWMFNIEKDIASADVELDDKERTQVSAYIRAQMHSGADDAQLYSNTLDYIVRLTAHRNTEQQNKALSRLVIDASLEDGE